MNTTELFDIDLKTLRAGVRSELTERAQFVFSNLDTVISAQLSEAYSDNPMSPDEKVPYYSREDVRKMLSTWQTPNKNDDNFEDNMNNPVHRSADGVDKLEKGETNKEDIEAGQGTLKVEEPNYERNNTLRFMKDLYFRESEEGDGGDIIYLDSDDDDFDEETFRKALIQAQTLDEVIELTLNDGNTLDLDSENINKILSSDSLFDEVLDGFDSLEEIAEILGINIGVDDGTTDGLGESEDPDSEFEDTDEPSPEIAGEDLKESVMDYLDSMIPEALLAINEATFNRTPQDISSLVAQMQQSGNKKNEQKNNKNRISRGRMAMVNRVRGGKLQMRKLISDSKGYKIVAGSAVRMKPSEIKKRRISARFASKKRRNMQAGINRKTKISIRFRHRRLGN